MHLKRYRSASVRGALGLARGELGADALVLSTRMVAMRGWRGWMGLREVELTAAADRGVSVARPVVQPADDEPAEPMSPSRPATGGAVAKLCATGLSEALAQEIAGALPRSARRSVSATALHRAAEHRLAPLAAGEEPPAAIEVFVGPPGAGKTTTIAKIAAQQRIKHRRRLGLISADGFRLGAIEQLRMYAEVMDTPFTAARSSADLVRALASAREPVLVDTAGRSPHDPAMLDILGTLTGHSGVRVHLVLPCAVTLGEAERVLAAYTFLNPDRVVVTKVDESESLSLLAGFLWEHRLAVSYLGTGQRVPEDLIAATPIAIAAQLLGGVDRGLPS